MNALDHEDRQTVARKKSWDKRFKRVKIPVDKSAESRGVVTGGENFPCEASEGIRGARPTVLFEERRHEELDYLREKTSGSRYRHPRERRTTKTYAAFQTIDSMLLTKPGKWWSREPARMHARRVARARRASVHDTGT